VCECYSKGGCEEIFIMGLDSRVRGSDNEGLEYQYELNFDVVRVVRGGGNNVPFGIGVV